MNIEQTIEQKIYVPPIKIQGIKTKIVPAIKPLIPKHDIWIEPFMGSGVVGFNCAQKAIFSDINPHLINFYNSIKKQEITSDIARVFLEKEGEKLSLDEKYYYEVRDRFNNFHNSLDFLFLNRSCFNGMIRFNNKGNFNVPFCKKTNRFQKAYITKIVNQIRYVEKMIKIYDWEFHCYNFCDILDKVSDNSFIYIDPPYIGRHTDYYGEWNEKDEEKLSQILKSTPAKFVLSTWERNAYRENDYIKKYWNWCNKINVEHFYYIGAKENNRNAMTEALLTNF